MKAIFDISKTFQFNTGKQKALKTNDSDSDVASFLNEGRSITFKVKNEQETSSRDGSQML